MRRGASILTLLLLLGAMLWLGWRGLEHEMDQPAAADAAIRIEVPAGASVRSVLAQLERQGAVRHARLVTLYLRLHRIVVRMQAGTYEIAAHATARSILDQFEAGRVVLESLTVVEGWNVQMLRRALDAHPAIAHQSRGQSDAQLMSALGHAGEPAEGRFFPDTYRFAAGTSDYKILQSAFDRMSAELHRAWDTRAPDLPLANADQALILASIIEKETGREDERDRVAAVFVNRLKLGMRLQTDPTVIYGLGERYDGNIHTRDLETDTPYNTYTRAGLPPTPIALPGAASLQAAVHPARSDALYFVATGNGDGSHHFSATLAEHDVALRAYLHKLGVSPDSHVSTPARVGGHP
ncbi:MAG TPA: endolytic transglycosylase MltG [Steroidobacteraceae bacterium]|jgi:UPF0755 protein|nr:endolytic transglycosylase MltG [Steroidobacteraceae bacterium]